MLHGLAVVVGLINWVLFATRLYRPQAFRALRLARDATDTLVMRIAETGMAIVGFSFALVAAIDPRAFDPAFGFLFAAVAMNSLLSLARSKKEWAP